MENLMALKATSVRLDDETLERVGQIAEAMDRPRAWLMSEAIKQYVAREEL
jgi:predicted transcriptional regulator